MQQVPDDPLNRQSGLGISSYLSEDTIASRISGPGGAISVLRISGPGALEHLEAICPQATQLQDRVMAKTRLVSSSGVTLDEAMVVTFKAPKSFTGENVVELFLHGGSFITNEVLRSLFSRGCRQALPGEFSFRAVRNGKLTIDQAQAIHDLVSASNVSAHQLALERLSGAQAKSFFEIAEILRSTLVLAEAGIDFSDQDLEELGLARLKERVRPCRERLCSISATIDRGRRIQEGVTVVIAGLPNAGKSTLFNELLGQERSLISEEAGTTRDVVREAVRLRRGDSQEEATFILHDTAGLRQTTGRVELMGIELTRKTVAAAELVLFIVDPASLEAGVEREWKGLGVEPERALLVLNKGDSLEGGLHGRRARDELTRWRSVLGIQEAVLVSSANHEGITELCDSMVLRTREWINRSPSETILTRQEQVESVNRAIAALDRAATTTAHDVFAADLRQSLDHLSFFVGATPVEEVLGKIFSQFCIGK